METKSFKELISRAPLEGEIRKNEDGSLYIAIGTIENKLDEMFDYWDWKFTNVIENKNTISGIGELDCSVNDVYSIVRTGTATIQGTLNKEHTLPLLEAMCILNAAKKLGKWFGRDLNREIDDKPLPTIRKGGDITDTEDDESIANFFNETKRKIQASDSREEAMRLLEESGFKLNNELKLLAQSKPE